MTRVSFILAIIGITLTCILAQDRYSEQYDYIDAKAILANDKLRNQYFNCIMNAGPCATADAKFFKELIFEAISTQCKKCTEKQKQMLDEISVWYTKNEPDKWNQVIEKSIEEAKKKNADQ